MLSDVSHPKLIDWGGSHRMGHAPAADEQNQDFELYSVGYSRYVLRLSRRRGSGLCLVPLAFNRQKGEHIMASVLITGTSTGIGPGFLCLSRSRNSAGLSLSKFARVAKDGQMMRDRHDFLSGKLTRIGYL
jgi:hypothetical protein